MTRDSRLLRSSAHHHCHGQKRLLELISIYLVSSPLSLPVTVVGLLALRSSHCRSYALSSQHPLTNGFQVGSTNGSTGRILHNGRRRSKFKVFLFLSPLASMAMARSFPWLHTCWEALFMGQFPLDDSESWVLVAAHPPAVPPALTVLAAFSCSQSLDCVIIPCLASQIFHNLCDQSPLLNPLCLNQLARFWFSWSNLMIYLFTQN